MKQDKATTIAAVQDALEQLSELPPAPQLNGGSTIASSADDIADEASAIIKRAAGLVLDKIENIQHRLDDYRQHLIDETVNAENSIKHTLLSISRVGQASVELDKQLDDLIAGKHADTRGPRESRDS